MGTNHTARKPKYRKELNPTQLQVLELLYKFRFGTSNHVQSAIGKGNATVTRKRLRILSEQGYIARHYNNTYKLQGRHASYYLRPKGFSALNLNLDEETQEKTSRRIYKSKDASERFIGHCLNVLSVFTELQNSFDNSFDFFVKDQLYQYDYFPEELPDAYIRFKSGERKGQHYFLQLYSSNVPFFVYKQRLIKLIDYEDGGDWDATGSELPILLAICDTQKLKDRVKKEFEDLLDDTLSKINMIVLVKSQLKDASFAEQF